MKTLGRVLAVVALLGFTPLARADLSPPPPTEVTVELTVDGLEKLPGLSFFVTNCREPIEESVLTKGKTLICPPKRGPLRIFGFRESDLNEMFSMVRRDAGTRESEAFLKDKAKTCGEIEGVHPILPGGGRLRFAAHYAVEPHGKSGCKLRRISVEKLPEPEPTPDPPTKPSATPPPPAADPPPAPAAKASSCGCQVPGSSHSTSELSLLAVLLLVLPALRAKAARRRG